MFDDALYKRLGNYYDSKIIGMNKLGKDKNRAVSDVAQFLSSFRGQAAWPTLLTILSPVDADHHVANHTKKIPH